MIRTRTRALLAMTTTTLTALATAAALLPASASSATTAATAAMPTSDEPPTVHVVDPPSVLRAGDATSFELFSRYGLSFQDPVVTVTGAPAGGTACPTDVRFMPGTGESARVSLRCSTDTAGGIAVMTARYYGADGLSRVAEVLRAPIDSPQIKMTARVSKRHLATGEPGHIRLSAQRVEADGSTSPVRYLAVERSRRAFGSAAVWQAPGRMQVELFDGTRDLRLDGSSPLFGDVTRAYPGLPSNRYRLAGATPSAPWQTVSFTVGSEYVHPVEQSHVITDVRFRQSPRGGGWVSGRLLVDGRGAPDRQVVVQDARSHLDDSWRRLTIADTDPQGRFTVRASHDFSIYRYLRVVPMGGRVDNADDHLIGTPSKVGSLQGRRKLTLRSFNKRTRSQAFVLRALTGDSACTQTVLVQRRDRGRWVTESRVRNDRQHCAGVARFKKKDGAYRLLAPGSRHYLATASPVVWVRYAG